MSLLRIPILVAACAALTACLAEDPPTGPLDAMVPDLVAPAADGAVGCESVTPVTITLDKLTGPSCSADQPFRGKAPGAAYVVVKGPKGWTAPAKVDLDGSFCVEVKLAVDSSNTLTFTPVDKAGCEGQRLVQTVTHSSSCSDKSGSGAAATGPSSNVAKGATVIASATPNSGKDADLVDGKLDTVARYSAGWGMSSADIRIDLALAKPYKIETIIVRWEDSKGDGCDYGEEYDVATSAVYDAGKVGESGWTTVEEVDDGDGGEDRFDLKHKPTVQHVGLKLRFNGCTSWSESFAIAEIEVFGADPTAQTAPVARCGQ